MNIQDETKPAEIVPAKSSRVTELPRTKKQITAAVIADGVAAKARWKTLMAEATIVWEKVPPEELATVDGNFHKLAGLVQLRYHISREESDRKVREFFDKHYPSA